MKLTKGNQSVEKTLRIIEVMADTAGGPLRLSDIAQEVDLPDSTVLRMLNTLVNMGYAYQEEGYLRRYGLTMKFLSVGQKAADHLSLRDIIHPYLAEMSAQTGETCCAAHLRGDRLVYIDVVTPSSGSALTIRQQIGGTAYLHCTGSGKMFLAQYTPEELDRLIRDTGLPALTPHTITDRNELVYELDKCRKNGYAVDDEEVEIGMRCLGAAVLDISGRAAAAICMSGPVSRMSRYRCEQELAPLLRRTAARITAAITGCGTGDPASEKDA